MLKSLRLRLTVIFSCLSGLILLLSLGATYWMSAQQYLESQETLLLQTFSAVREELGKSDSISDAWLKKQETPDHIAIWISDNNVPFHFSGIWDTQTPRNELASRAQREAAARGLSGMMDGTKTGFTIQGQQEERYHCAVAYLGCPQPLCLVMLQADAPQRMHLMKTGAVYCLIALLGVACLVGISWFLAGMALKPTVEALRRQTKFIAAASHELRSPLTVIKASLSAARRADRAESESFLDTAQQEAGRMARLIDDLLTLAGSDAGAWHICRSDVELDTFCIDLYERFHTVCHDQGHVLTLELPDEPLPHLSLDRERLTQLFGILLSNACSYPPKGTPIEICACSEPHFVELSVIDHGPGIPDPEKEAVFRRFYRGDASRTEKQHFGLGLSVAAELAALHAARLTVRDTPGGGASFVLRLSR